VERLSARTVLLVKKRFLEGLGFGINCYNKIRRRFREFIKPEGRQWGVVEGIPPASSRGRKFKPFLIAAKIRVSRGFLKKEGKLSPEEIPSPPGDSGTRRDRREGRRAVLEAMSAKENESGGRGESTLPGYAKKSLPCELSWRLPQSRVNEMGSPPQGGSCLWELRHKAPQEGGESWNPGC